VALATLFTLWHKQIILKKVYSTTKDNNRQPSQMYFSY
jgi:hypothetical protein